ncbi:hypothetical protein CBL_21316 [Carabus blaptoides fortunei]
MMLKKIFRSMYTFGDVGDSRCGVAPRRDYCTNKRAKSSLHNSIIAEVSTTCAQGGGIDHSYMSSRVAEVAEIPVAIFMHLSPGQRKSASGKNPIAEEQGIGGEI